MPPFVETFRALPARSKAIIAVSGVAILAIAFLLLRIAGAPSYSMLASGLDPSKTGEITAALDEQGIAYELRNKLKSYYQDEAPDDPIRIEIEKGAYVPRFQRRAPAAEAVPAPAQAPVQSGDRPISSRWKVVFVAAGVVLGRGDGPQRPRRRHRQHRSPLEARHARAGAARHGPRAPGPGARRLGR